MTTEMTSQQKRLFDKAQIINDSGCWIWQGQVSNSGYGRTNIKLNDGNVKMVSAQTASYIAFTSELPTNQLVKQRCGNRLCINPEHLELIKVD